MKKNIFSVLSTAFVVVALMAMSSCGHNNINPNDKGDFSIEFESRVGDNELVLNTQTYKNALNQDFTVTKFNYYVSNIVLTNADGTKYTVPQNESYFLISSADKASQTITLKNVQEGDYTGISFIVGVDSLRSTLDMSERTGVLDPAAGASDMYWSWNSGYIFMKMEGTSPQAPLDSVTNTRNLYYHIGGFGANGSINNIRKVEIAFGGDKAEVRNDASSEAHFYVDAAKVVNGTTNIDFSTHSDVMFGAFSTKIADNYKSMFSLMHIHNEH